jgi:hypothetical protein
MSRGRWLVAALAAALSLQAIAAPSPGPTGDPVGSVTVRVAITKFTSDLMGQGPPPVLSGDGLDWIVGGYIAAQPPLDQACRGDGRSGHSRFIDPSGIEFTIVMDGTADCLHAPYAIRLWANYHGNDDLIDLSEDPAADFCQWVLSGDPEQAADCVGTIPYALLQGPMRGDIDGRRDGRTAEHDGILDYEARVVASTLPLPEAVQLPEGPGWVVHVDLAGVVVDSPEPTESDWLFDGGLRSADGDPACATDYRTGHSLYQVPAYLDIVLYGGASCGGKTMQLKLIAYEHATDALLDVNGDPAAGACPGLVTPKREWAAGCGIDLAFPLVDGLTLPSVLADGHLDGDPCLPPDCLKETNARVEYGLRVWRHADASGVHLRFDFQPGPTNVLGLASATDDWLLDGQARGEGCLAQARTGHSRFFSPTLLDLVFRGPGAAACAAQPLDIELVPYSHTTEMTSDIDPRLEAEGGSPCMVYNGMPLSDQGCRLRLAWNPGVAASAGSTSGVADGALDGFADVNDASIAWHLSALPR